MGAAARQAGASGSAQSPGLATHGAEPHLPEPGGLQPTEPSKCTDGGAAALKKTVAWGADLVWGGCEHTGLREALAEAEALAHAGACPPPWRCVHDPF